MILINIDHILVTIPHSRVLFRLLSALAMLQSRSCGWWAQQGRHLWAGRDLGWSHLWSGKKWHASEDMAHKGFQTFVMKHLESTEVRKSCRKWSRTVSRCLIEKPSQVGHGVLWLGHWADIEECPIRMQISGCHGLITDLLESLHNITHCSNDLRSLVHFFVLFWIGSSEMPVKRLSITKKAVPSACSFTSIST